MMSSCMTKLEFLPEPYMLFRLEARKTSTYMLLAFALGFVKLCWPLWEICHALKNQDHVHTTQICTTPTLGVGTKTCVPSRSTQKCFTPTLGVNTKTCLIGFPSTQNKCSKVLVDISLKVLLQKSDMGYGKVIYKIKERKRELRKNGQVSQISKTMGT